MSDWLADFNEAARLATADQLDAAASLYADVAVRVADDPTVTSKLHYEMALRRADVAGRLARKQETLLCFSEATQIAVEDLQDEQLVAQACRKLLETIRRWQDWELLARTAQQLNAFGQHHGLTAVCLEAGWHMPYAYRGLGQPGHAREHAAAILEKMRETGHAEGIREWEEFLDSLPSDAPA